MIHGSIVPALLVGLGPSQAELPQLQSSVSVGANTAETAVAARMHFLVTDRLFLPSTQADWSTPYSHCPSKCCSAIVPSRAVSSQNTNLMLPRYNLDALLEFVLCYQEAHLSYHNCFQCAYLDLIHSFLGLSSPEKIIINSGGGTHRCWEPITLVEATITGTHHVVKFGTVTSIVTIHIQAGAGFW